MGGYGALLLDAQRHFCAVDGRSPALWFSGADSAADAFDDAADYARHLRQYFAFYARHCA